MKLLLTQTLCVISSACNMIILRDGYKREYRPCISYFYWNYSYHSYYDMFYILAYKGSKHGMQINSFRVC